MESSHIVQVQDQLSIATTVTYGTKHTRITNSLEVRKVLEIEFMMNGQVWLIC